MAKETKSLTVHPDDEARQIDLWQAFGWELFSTQEVFSKDSHLERGVYNTINSVTETTHYIKLTFQRDTDIPHYAEYRTLENEFNSLVSPGNPPAEFSMFSIILGWCLFLPAGIYMLIKNQKIKAQIPEWEARHDAYLDRRKQILERAYSLKA